MMTEKEMRIEKLRDELADFLDAMTEENFDEERLNAILAELDELDPITDLKDPEIALKEFWEYIAETRPDLLPPGRP